MTDENKKHSTKEFRCEEFHKLGLNDEQIEKVEKVIFEHYLDYGLNDSRDKIIDKERKIRTAASDIKKLIGSIKSIEASHPNNYARLIDSVSLGLISHFWESNNRGKELDCPAPLPYLEIMERSFRHYSSAHNYKGFNTFENENSKEIVTFELSSKRNERKGVNSQTYSPHYKALHDLTVLWQFKFKNKIIKSNDSVFMRFLSIVFHGNDIKTDAMRHYYNCNYNVKIEIHPIDSNEI